MSGLCGSVWVQGASDTLQKGQTKVAANKLEALKNEIRAQSGKKIDVESAEKLLQIIDKIMFSIDN